MTLEKRNRRLQALRNLIQRLDRHLIQLRNRSDQLTRWRLASFALFVILGSVILLTFGALVWATAGIILLLPFLMTVVWHRRVERSIDRHLLWRRLKKAQLARMVLDWDNIPPVQRLQILPEHLFAIDLDLVGDRSIFRLLDVSLTLEGGQRLGDWLLETEPDPKRTMRRQAIVSELMQMPAFCDRLNLNAAIASEKSAPELRFNPQRRSEQRSGQHKWSADRLLKWLNLRTEIEPLRKVLVLLLLLVPVNFALLVGHLTGWLPPLWIASWFVYAAIVLSQSRKVEPLFRNASLLSDSLRQLAAVFNILEKRSLENRPALWELCAPLRHEKWRPSEQLKRANRLLVAAGLRLNPALGFLLNALVPWDVFFAYRLDVFKLGVADLLPGWLDLWYELEALNGLANFGYLYPEATFAKIIPLSRESSLHEANGDIEERVMLPFVAHDIGHPLIAAEERVGNDFSVLELGTTTIVTGSNMAGKSSFLRTIGVNIRLALAGAPVLASSLRLVPFRVAASITVTDSVTDGFSFFYAEVTRLKALLDELKRPHPYPLFFLIDEIFRGTNNRERLIGSRSFVQALTGCYGMGVIATHDLELVKLGKTNPNIRNAHFRDDVQGDRMVFDYKLHPGPCPTTNALRIMRLAGLPIDLEGLEETFTP
ncbi:MAG: hypothetical protein GWP61_11860 [Chloroflexi bacterium]|jgi:ABC-type multidrug transport system fused ATPase/permease subunit|nr:hypothetical protein [Chloroflexota bacterium]